MKNLFFVLVFLGALSCTSPPSEDKIHITYTVAAFDVAASKMEVSFEIKNNTATDYTSGNWQLHWNQMGGQVDADSLPEGVTYEWVNGAYYFILTFGNNWALPAGGTVRFSFTHNGIMERVVMGPRGAFLVQNGQAKDAEVNIHWKKAKGLVDLKLPTAAKRYNERAALSLLNKDALAWVAPTPKKQSIPSGFRAADSHWTIALDENFKTHQNLLQQFLSDSFMQSIQLEANTTSNFNIVYNSKLSAEAYSLSIQSNSIEITAADYGGIVYGLQSLRQIIQTASLEQLQWPLIEIEDTPRFKYRGFLLDISRNFYNTEKVKQILDVMSLFKLNALDFKLADDEGWRIEIPGLEELTSVGSKRGYTTTETDRLIPMYGSGASGGVTGSGYISRKEFINLLQYAHARNIQIMPQISFPSHARSAIKAMNARYLKYKAAGDMEAAEQYLLIDPEDQSEYRSAQLYNDNIICICRESAYTFFDKVVNEMATMYNEAEVPLKQFSIGADELPYGSWRKSPLCSEFIANNPLGITSVEALYEYNLKRLKKILDDNNVRMAGWEDIMLDRSEKSQSETQIRKENFNFEVIPYVWNNTWGAGREDMIYKFANRGFKTIMSNSSAFYFDMTDDNDIENYGLDWSGYVNYKDAWGTDPENVFGNLSLNKKHGMTPEYIAKKVPLDPKKRENLIGIQSQLWTETVVNEAVLDELVLPNMIIFAERAWQQRPNWLQLRSLAEQQAAMNVAWNRYANQIGQRVLPFISSIYPKMQYDLPKPGATLINDSLYVKQQFPGLSVHYTTNGTIPTLNSAIYKGPIPIEKAATVVLRTFDINGRGGRSIHLE